MEASVSADDDRWKNTDLKWQDEVGVRLRVAFAGTGEVVARGSLRGTLQQECRRCLKGVESDACPECGVALHRSVACASVATAASRHPECVVNSPTEFRLTIPESRC